MKKNQLCLLLLFALFQATFAQKAPAGKPAPAVKEIEAVPQPLYKPTILVEFYTSEGCSSCPMADEFGMEIRRMADSTRSLVYVIDWHVDLWDRSGWKDPYSDSNYTARQLKMALKNNQKAMFTPMVFVNGTGALPAGAKSETGALISDFVRKPALHFLLFSASWYASDKRLVMEYEIKGTPDSCDVFFALVEKEVTSNVTAGENKGRTLTHHNVVRKLETSFAGTAFGTASLRFDADAVDFSRYRVVGFIQHKRTFQVLAAQVLEFKSQQ
jgi:hypothetical protein